MKSQSFFLACLLLLSACAVKKERTGPLSLSADHPQPGSTLSFTFDPLGTELEDDSIVLCVVHYFTDEGSKAGDVGLERFDEKWKGSLEIPGNASAVALQFNPAEGKGKYGQAFMLYSEDGKAVQGAHVAIVEVYGGWGEYYLGIERNADTAQALMEEEFALWPESKIKYLVPYTNSLLSHKKEAEAREMVAEMARTVFGADTTREKSLLTVYNVYRRQLKENNTADSLEAIIRDRYPNGFLAAEDLGKAFSQEKNPGEKTAIYQEYIQKYPEGSENAQVSDAAYDYMRMQLARAFAGERDYENFRKYAGLIKDPANRGQLYNSIAWGLAEKGEGLEFASGISKQSLDITQEAIKDPAGTKPGNLSESQWKRRSESAYAMYADTYALILYKQGKLEEALSYQKQAVGKDGGQAEVNERYAMMLKDAGKTVELMGFAEKAIKKGNANSRLKDYLQAAYKIEKGNDTTGWGNYMAGLEKIQMDELRARLTSEMIREKAPGFSLVNMKGEEVSLEALSRN